MSISPLNGSSNDLDCLLEKLRPFQREAYDFATAIKSTSKSCKSSKKKKGMNHGGRGRLLLGDEMGLGKTVTSLAVMLAYREEWPLLILCPASLRYTWPAEIEKFYPFLPHSAVYVVKGFDDCDFFSNPNKRSRIKIVVATYSLLQNRSAAARVLNQFEFKCVIADESHNLKERNSQRCKLAMPLLQGARRLILLSGTPALARPVELWAQLHCIDAELFGSYTSYTKKYCNARRGRFGWDVKGISNADELHEKLKSVMVRRLKADVLDDLPPKQRSIVPVKIQNSKHMNECADLISKMNEAKLSMKSLDGEEAANANFEARSLLMQAYQASGIGKAESVSNYVVDWLKGSGTQKLLVFAHHIEVLNTIEMAVSKHFKGVTHIRIDGSVSSAERASRVRKFQTKPHVRLGLLSMTAAGVGLTLTAATTVIFAELHWTPGVLAQAEDRCHRIGQVNSVNIIYCVCKERELSVDLSLWAMIGRKVNNLGRMIDGERNASMNAQNVENSSEELTSFFAENNPNQKLPDDNNAVPVKGSIQSFFLRNSKQPKQKYDEVKNESNNRFEMRPVQKPKAITTSSPATNRMNKSWPCDRCTFINESSLTLCQMCGNARKRQVTPCGEKSSSELNMHVTKSADKCCDSPMNIIDLSQSNDDINTQDYIGTKNLIQPFHHGISLQPQVHNIEQKTTFTNRESLIQFKVSLNSGRIAIFGLDGVSLNFNFDIDDIISETTGEILETYVKRTTTQQRQCMSSKDVDFNQGSVKKVVERLISQTDSYLDKSDINQLCMEIKYFVQSYLVLREIEKKSIREYSRPIKHDAVSSTVRKIVLRSFSSNQSGLDRYSGGSKERANENLSKGPLSESDQRILDGKACSWCGRDLNHVSLHNGVKSTYCSQACAEEGRLKRGGMFASSRIREQLFSLEQGKCQKCGIDANALFIRIQSLKSAERLNALINANWHLPKTKKALDRLLQNPKEGDFWQADHIVPVAEGGGSCGLENLRTLCTPCHQSETEKLRFRLRLQGPVGRTVATRPNQDGERAVGVEKRIQKKRDLRDFFVESSSRALQSSVKRKKQRCSPD